MIGRSSSFYFGKTAEMRERADINVETVERLCNWGRETVERLCNWGRETVERLCNWGRERLI